MVEDILYEDREMSIRTLDAIDRQISAYEDRIDEYENKIENLKELRLHEDDDIKRLDRQALRLYGPNGARARGFYVP